MQHYLGLILSAGLASGPLVDPMGGGGGVLMTVYKNKNDRDHPALPILMIVLAV